jgi:Peptidase A4 family
MLTLPTATALAQGHVDLLSTSKSWAGYIVTRRARHDAFKAVAGTWVQPLASCIPGRFSTSFFWVGLGGFQLHGKPFKIEQIGTEADCTTSGQASYGAWYELAPKPPIHIRIPITPGDLVSAAVTMSGVSASFRLVDQSNGRVFAKRRAAPAPDLSSAEWITEAPLECYKHSCIPQPLTDFGTIGFSGALAQAPGGQVAGILSPSWVTIESKLKSAQEAASESGEPLFVEATPSLISDTSFSVTWGVIAGPPPAP